MPVIFYSLLDPAGRNIASKLGKSVEVLALDTPLVSADHLAVETDLVVFASKHKSASAKPCLTVHAPGNFGKAELGGRKKELALTSARALKAAHDFLKANPVEGFDAFREATHHGPTALKTPCLFIEIGSTEKEWANEAAAERVAECIEFVCREWRQAKGKTALGFGGGHYCPAFNSLEGFAFSHIAAKYALPSLDEGMVRQMAEKTVEPVECAVIDWKGCGGEERKKTTELVVSAGLELVRV